MNIYRLMTICRVRFRVFFLPPYDACQDVPALVCDFFHFQDGSGHAGVKRSSHECVRFADELSFFYGISGIYQYPAFPSEGLFGQDRDCLRPIRLYSGLHGQFFVRSVRGMDAAGKYRFLFYLHILFLLLFCVIRRKVLPPVWGAPQKRRGKDC